MGDAAMGRRDEDSLRLEQQVAVQPGQRLLFGWRAAHFTSEPKSFLFPVFVMQNTECEHLFAPNLLSSSFPLTYTRTTKVFYGHTIYSRQLHDNLGAIIESPALYPGRQIQTKLSLEEKSVCAWMRGYQDGVMEGCCCGRRMRSEGNGSIH